MDHLTLDEYWETLRGKRSFDHLARQAHEHLVDACPTCRDGWTQRDDVGFARLSTRSPEHDVPPSLPSDERAVSLDHLQRSEDLLSQSREAARLAREDVKLLLALPPEQWAQRVERARTRLRSRAFVELLLEEARRRLERAPEEAERLAALVRPALDRREGRLAEPWARELLAAAETCCKEARERL